ncbi:MAG: hypothetical protein ACI9NC_005475, partial [Verrucomicrobiales bacterium]
MVSLLACKRLGLIGGSLMQLDLGERDDPSM